MSHPRPASVIAIVLLKILDGLLGLASGCALIGGSSAVAAALLNIIRDAPQWLIGLVSGTLACVGVLLAAFALLDFILAWGVWTLRRWAWWLTLITSIVSIIGPLITLLGGNLTSIPSILINSVVIVLLFTSNVRRAMINSGKIT